MIIKNSKSTHPIILIFSLLLLTLSLILPCNSNANSPGKIGDINNNDLVNPEDVATDNSTLRDCIKVSTQITKSIRYKGRGKAMLDFVHVLHERPVGITDLAKQLGMSQPGVGYAVNRGEKIAKEHKYQLL